MHRKHNGFTHFYRITVLQSYFSVWTQKHRLINFPFFFSLVWTVTKNQILNNKCQQKFLVVISIQKGRRQPCLFSFCIETSKKLWLAFGHSFTYVVNISEHWMSWIFEPFFENAHVWKPHHWNPHEPKTQCIWFLVTGRSNEKNNVKTIFCLGSEWVIRNIVLNRFLYAHPPFKCPTEH